MFKAWFTHNFPQYGSGERSSPEIIVLYHPDKKKVIGVLVKLHKTKDAYKI